MIWENLSGSGIYKVHVTYSGTHEKYQGHASGHNIIAESPGEALRIVEQYKVGNPFGRDDIWNRKVVGKFEGNKECLRGSRSGIWAEENGTLVNIRERLEQEPNGTTKGK